MATSNRHHEFGVVIHAVGAEKFDFSAKTKLEITEILRELSFVTPSELSKILLNIKVQGNKKRNSEERYFSVIKDIKGQLELGFKNNKPHYQVWIKMNSLIVKGALLKALSQAIYGESKSSAISVQILSEDSEDFQKYCTKHDNADLCDEYSHVVLTKAAMEFELYMQKNPEAKKYWILRMGINVG